MWASKLKIAVSTRTVRLNRKNQVMQTITSVETVPLERDDRADAIKSHFSRLLQGETGFTRLGAEQQVKVKQVLDSLMGMRFSNRASLLAVVRAMVEPLAPDLSRYLDLTMEAAAGQLQADKGVLVIYTGGTIGSAPKDDSDPDSPQVVRPWADLKNALPNLSRLGYPIDAVAFVEPLDSCNVGPRHWFTLCQLIQKHYHEYEGFVILHGTDSMVFTASALAFMLQGLGKPVVLTGSQVAGIVNARNDAHQNVITALQLANPRRHGIHFVPEVLVAFGNVVLRGCRSKKFNVIGYQGFESPNYPHLGEAGEFVTINPKVARMEPSAPDLQVLDKLNANVIMLEVFPGMQNSPILANVLADPNLRGVVLKSYGAGNIPTDVDFLMQFKGFIDKGGVVLCVTGVPEGEVVMGLYETSQVLLDIGIIGGFDITPEAALTKLQVVLGNFGDDINQVRVLLNQSIAGEQRLSLKVTSLNGGVTLSAAQASAKTQRAPLQSVVDAQRIEKVMLRLQGVSLRVPEAGTSITLEVKLDKPDGVDNFRALFKRRGTSPVGTVVRDSGIKDSMAFDLTAYKKYFAEAPRTGAIGMAQSIGFSLALLDAGACELQWESAELNIFFGDV
jgi:L-asparaginase